MKRLRANGTLPATRNLSEISNRHEDVLGRTP